MSLNFKQMALYYSPAFFFWLLAWSLWCCRTAVGELLVSIFCLKNNIQRIFVCFLSPEEAFQDFLTASCVGDFVSFLGGRSETPLCAWFRGVVSRVLGLGVVVILSFAILWAPFCIYPGEESCLSSLKQASRLQCSCPSLSQDCLFSLPLIQEIFCLFLQLCTPGMFPATVFCPV